MRIGRDMKDGTMGLCGLATFPWYPIA